MRSNQAAEARHGGEERRLTPGQPAKRLAKPLRQPLHDHGRQEQARKAGSRPLRLRPQIPPEPDEPPGAQQFDLGAPPLERDDLVAAPTREDHPRALPRGMAQNLLLRLTPAERQQGLRLDALGIGRQQAGRDHRDLGDPRLGSRDQIGHRRVALAGQARPLLRLAEGIAEEGADGPGQCPGGEDGERRGIEPTAQMPRPWTIRGQPPLNGLGQQASGLVGQLARIAVERQAPAGIEPPVALGCHGAVAALDQMGGVDRADVPVDRASGRRRRVQHPACRHHLVQRRAGETGAQQGGRRRGEGEVLPRRLRINQRPGPKMVAAERETAAAPCGKGKIPMEVSQRPFPPLG